MIHCIPGLVFELGEVSGTFDAAYERSHQRLREEAHALGAHGVIGVVDSIKKLTGSSITEFHLTGTAVRIDGMRVPDELPWTTYLDAQQLAKLLEVGLMPVEIVTSFSSLLLVMSAYGKWIKSGQAYRSMELPELRKLAELSLAEGKKRAYAKIGADSLHGVTVDDSVRDSADMITVRDCLIRGTRVRRFAERDPQPVPSSILGLG
jgi:phosphopantetheine adenylyltransferase